MKGVVFTEFLEMVEEAFSPDMADNIIEASTLSSGGVYTTLGTYDHEELLQLVTHLSQETSATIPELVRSFGEHLFTRFFLSYPIFFEDVDSSFDFLLGLEDYIHVEVKKLYNDAELPSFEYDTSQPGRFVMVYRSSRPFGDLAEGLIRGCIAHFKEQTTLEREDLSPAPKTCIRFTLTRPA